MNDVIRTSNSSNVGRLFAEKTVEIIRLKKRIQQLEMALRDVAFEAKLEDMDPDDCRETIIKKVERALGATHETCEQPITRQTLENWALIASDPDKYGEKDWAETFRRALGRSSEKAVDHRLPSDDIRDLACCDRFVRSSASEFCDECGYTNLDHLRKQHAKSE